MRERTSASQACGSTPFILHVTTRLYAVAARCPPRSEPQKSHDFRPRAMPLSPLSAALLERQTRPSFKEQGEARPPLQDVVECFGQVVPTGELGDLLAHVGVKILDQWPAQRSPDDQTFLGALAIDRSLNLKQRVDPTHDLDGDRRQRDFLFARGLATSVLLDISHSEERAPGVRPTRRFPNGAGLSRSQIELVIPVIGVRLQDTGILGQMRLGMFAFSVARIVEHRRRWARSAKRPVVPHIDPTSARVSLALG